MLNWGIILTTCIIALVKTDEESHEYGKYGESRKTICSKQNRAIYEDLEVCYQTESKAVIEATTDCINKIAPSAEGSTVEFMEIACADKSVFLNFDECMSEYEKDYDYKKEMKLRNETIECYQNVLEKYDLHDLKPILEEEIAAAKGEHSETHE